MQKLILSVAALAAVGVIVPCVAPAQAEETVVIKKHHHRHFMPVERHHEGRTVIIKKHGVDRD
jgi:hypothetical protein